MIHVLGGIQQDLKLKMCLYLVFSICCFWATVDCGWLRSQKMKLWFSRGLPSIFLILTLPRALANLRCSTCTCCVNDQGQWISLPVLPEFHFKLECPLQQLYRDCYADASNCLRRQKGWWLTAKLLSVCLDSSLGLPEWKCDTLGKLLKSSVPQFLISKAGRVVTPAYLDMTYFPNYFRKSL
jgi:hypothetical protein